MERRNGNTIGQPPKYIGYEDDLYKVIKLFDEPNDNGGLVYLCECKLCGGEHTRNTNQLGRKSRSRDCPQYRSYNWSGLEREDNIMQTKYGISLDDFHGMSKFQNHSCAICSVPLDNMSRRANIDHDHDTGKVRGLLCTGCNTGLGHLGDNIEGLERAMYYLMNTPYSEYTLTLDKE